MNAEIESRKEVLSDKITLLAVTLHSLKDQLQQAEAACRVNRGFVERDAAEKRLRELLSEHGEVSNTFQATLKEWAELK